MTRSFLIVHGLCLFMIFGCAEKTESLEERQFAVDTLLVQKKEVFSKHEFSFNPPNNWERLPQEVFDELKVRLKTVYPNQKGIYSNPIDLFYNSENKSMLYISSVGFMGIESDPLEEYEDVLRDNLDDSVKYEKYIKDGIIILQCVIRENGRINYKIIFESAKKSLVQFDYLFSEAVYQEEFKAMQSSLGALKKLK